MKKFIKELFYHPPAEELKARHLAVTERDLLEAEAVLECALAERDMLKKRLVRLTKKEN